MSERSRRIAVAAIGAIAVVVGLVGAWQRRWLCDDAFIVFRYARNFVDGHGLVFNVGERVEGYTDFLWVLWNALGLRLGVGAERWSVASGLLAWLGTLLILWRTHRRLAGPDTLPIALIAVALHPDLQTFATSGLETSLFILLLVAGTALLVDESLLLAGVLFGLAALTRADGPLLGATAAALVLWRYDWKRALRFAAPIAALHVPFLLWRHHYYGSFVPNTYFAKSADLTWWSQGVRYLALYLFRYGFELLALPLAGWLLLRRRACTPAVIFATLGAVYALYVTRVGGDFMYARLLLPCAPFWLMAVDLALSELGVRALVQLGVAVLLCATPLVLPDPLAHGRRWGVADERAYYLDPVRQTWSQEVGALLRKTNEAHPLGTLALAGSEAQIAYLSGVHTAIELHGLTDAHIAHQPLAERGRPGHEKKATPEYLVTERGAQLMLLAGEFDAAGLGRYVPAWPIELAPGVRPLLLRWDPPLVAALRARGAKIPDFPAFLDRYLAQKALGVLPPDRIRRDLPLFQHFYFDHVDDPQRKNQF